MLVATSLSDSASLCVSTPPLSEFAAGPPLEPIPTISVLVASEHEVSTLVVSGFVGATASTVVGAPCNAFADGTMNDASTPKPSTAA